MWQAMKAYDYLDKMPVVSEERIREELTKCFKCNSSLTLGWLSELTDLRDYILRTLIYGLSQLVKINVQYYNRT